VLFPFGYGLSYTSFSYSNLVADGGGRAVTFTVTNTGKRAGTEIAQVYATPPEAAGEGFKRLAGWQRVMLAPGESKTVTISLDPRVLSVFDEQSSTWKLVKGSYRVVAGPSSAETPLRTTLPFSAAY
jgi:beta-glucosidase